VNIIKISIAVVTLILAFFLGLYGTTSSALAKTLPVEYEKTIESEVDRLSIKYNISSSTVNKIIACESKMYGQAVNHNYAFRTVTFEDGSTTSIKYVWSHDFGPLQINDFWHEKTMTKMGLDIHDQWDSLEYGFFLMKKQGLKPWSASKKCWSK